MAGWGGGAAQVKLKELWEGRAARHGTGGPLPSLG